MESELMIKLLEDHMSDISVILTNKYKMHRKALRLIKRFFIVNNWSWELKTLCDILIYTDSSPLALKEFLVNYLNNN